MEAQINNGLDIDANIHVQKANNNSGNNIDITDTGETIEDYLLGDEYLVPLPGPFPNQSTEHNPQIDTSIYRSSSASSINLPSRCSSQSSLRMGVPGSMSQSSFTLFVQNRMNRVLSAWWTPTLNENEEEFQTLMGKEGIFGQENVHTCYQAPNIISNVDVSFSTAPKHFSSNSMETSLLWILLNFKNNPIKNADMRLSLLSNFSTCFNMVNISLALDMMYAKHSSELASNDLSVCSSALLFGMIFGQLCGGTMGDVLGRHRAMAIIMAIQIFSSFASAFVGKVIYGEFFSIYQQLAIWRFLLGVGCGGAYPLSAVITAESSNLNGERAKLCALTFSMQGVGFFASPVIAYVLIMIFGEDSDVSWRLQLGIGCVPGVILAINELSRWHRDKKQEENNREDNEKNLSDDENSDDHQTVWGAIALEENLVPKLLGTAGSWFLADITFYGNTLFQPLVLRAAFGDNETLRMTARDTCINEIPALLGYFFTVAFIGSLSPKQIHVQGFFAMAVLYFIIAQWFELLKDSKVFLLLLYGLTFFFTNFGPNTTTYVLPPMTYSKQCRSTLNGVCAACGKTGAFLGAVFFKPAKDMFGQSAVLYACAIFALAGFFNSCFFVSDTVGLGNIDKNEMKQMKEEFQLRRNKCRKNDMDEKNKRRKDKDIEIF